MMKIEHHMQNTGLFAWCLESCMSISDDQSRNWYFGMHILPVVGWQFVTETREADAYELHDARHTVVTHPIVAGIYRDDDTRNVVHPAPLSDHAVYISLDLEILAYRVTTSPTTCPMSMCDIHVTALASETALLVRQLKYDLKHRDNNTHFDLEYMGLTGHREIPPSKYRDVHQKLTRYLPVQLMTGPFEGHAHYYDPLPVAAR